MKAAVGTPTRASRALRSRLCLAALCATTLAARAQQVALPTAPQPQSVSVAQAQTATPLAPDTPLGQPATPLAGQTPGQLPGPGLQLPSPSGDPRRTPPSTPGALTLPEVLARAREHNPSLLAARQNLLGTRAQEVQAGVRANPYLAVAGQDVTLPASGASNPYSYSVQVSRLFERGEKRRWRLDTALATTGQTDAQLHDQERATELNVKQAFTAMLIAKASLTLADENLRDFRREVDINNERYKAGDIGKLDFERLDLQLAQFESDRATAAINLRQASDQLQTLMGIGVIDPTFDIAGDVVPPVVAPSLAELTRRALTERPDYRAAQFAVRAADANVKLAYANGTTDPTLEGEYDRSAGDNSAGFNISIPLRIFDRNQGNKDTAKYQAQASRYSQSAVLDQVSSDVDQAYVGYEQSKQLSDRYNSHYLDEATDVLQIAQFAYEHGGIALIDYLDALRDSRIATAAALAAYSSTWLAIDQLSYATATEVAP